MDSKSNFRIDSSGNILFGFLGLLGIAALISYFADMNIFQSRVYQKKLNSAHFIVDASSAIETFLIAYREAEVKYVETVTNYCPVANSFVRALREGSGCAKAGTIMTFTGADAGTSDQLYTYSGSGCAIDPTSSSCFDTKPEILNIGVKIDNQPIDGVSYKIFFVAAMPEKSAVEFSFQSTDGLGNRGSGRFYIRESLSNAAHLEADGRVTQEQPDPLALCPGTIWGSYFVWDTTSQTCMQFSQLGSGTGLAFYSGRYFGFRPFDGQIIDLQSTLNPKTKSYLVQQNGTLSGIKIFPSYDKSQLTNVDDITLIDDQIYYVAGMGSSAQIGMLDPFNGLTRKTICDLGGAGWSQAYSGIAALSWSQPLLPLPSSKSQRNLAVFFLKTDSGDLLQVIAIARSGGIKCWVNKDLAQQDVEYKRTNGFDRTEDAKPYFIF